MLNVQGVKITYHISELMKCLPSVKALWHSAKYHAHLKHQVDLFWSLNRNILSDNHDHDTRSPSSTIAITSMA